MIEKDKQLNRTGVTNVKSYGKPLLGGKWTLVDMNGQIVTENSAKYAGKYTLIYFGFTHCPDICPNELVKTAQVLDKLKKIDPKLAANIVPIFITVDPGRDSIAKMQKFAQQFHPDIEFLTGK
jgi:protein SCO1/2